MANSDRSPASKIDLGPGAYLYPMPVTLVGEDGTDDLLQPGAQLLPGGELAGQVVQRGERLPASGPG